MAVSPSQSWQPEPTEVDVLIIGSGSAGLMAAVWLAVYNHYHNANIKYAIIERRDGPLKIGQADGVQCRTVEIFEALGLEHFLLKEAYWVNEVCFWAATDDDDCRPASTTTNGSNETSVKHRPIRRTGRTADTAPGLSHQPHVILNQARINELLIEKIRSLDSTEVIYNETTQSITTTAHPTHPILVTTTSTDDSSQTRTYHARYALGSDGAHSTVRRSLSIPMEGDSTNAVWGVMDCFVDTSFPDIRKKSTIRADTGTLLIIPREGDRMVRFYIEMPSDTVAKQVSLADLQAKAQAIFKPYEMVFTDTKWWSAYAIGQRLAREMQDVSGRIFLAGDACHTHSPKAGQGMNCSLQDGDNFGWKIASVISGQARPEIMQSYVVERQEYARSLIEFDRRFAKMFSSSHGSQGATPKEFEQGFIQAGMFTAGMAARYGDPMLTDPSSSTELCKNLTAGMRLPSAQVVRFSDSKPVHLQTLCALNGKWRLFVFSGHAGLPGDLTAVNELTHNLYANSTSRIARFLETVVIIHGSRHAFEPEHFDSYLHTATSSNLMGTDTSNRIFFDDESYNHGHGQAYERLGISISTSSEAAGRGCAILVRPDQYVSGVYRLNGWREILTFFEAHVSVNV